MRVGRDVHDRLKNRVQGGLRLVPGEHIDLIIRLSGRKPAADCLVVTNARVLSIASTGEPLTWTHRQALADEVHTWRLYREFRSRLTVTTGYGRTEVFGSGLSVHDDNLVDAQLTTLVSSRGSTATMSAVKALRAEAHWVASGYGRSVYVLDRGRIPPPTAEAVDVDMVERQLSLLDYWPSSEVRRHLAVCLPLGGCCLGSVESVAQAAATSMPVAREHVDAVSRALVVVDTLKIKKSAGAEADVLQRLMAVVAHIRATPAWNSLHLDHNDLRIDVDDEVRRVALWCHRIAQLRTELGERPEEQSETGRQAALLHDTSVVTLDAVARRLEARVTSLASYRDRLLAFSRELADVESADRVSGVAEKVANLAAMTVGDDEAGRDLAGMVPHPREANDALPQAIASLREEVDRIMHRDGSPADAAVPSGSS